jgi:hypothetical protein
VVNPDYLPYKKKGPRKTPNAFEKTKKEDAIVRSSQHDLHRERERRWPREERA